MKELLQGRRFGFAPRPFAGQVALGLALGASLLDLMAWGGWGVRQTNALVVGALWLTVAAAVLGALALVLALAELPDSAPEDAGFARIDVAAALVATLVLAGSAFLRATDLSVAAAPPAPFLMSLGAVVLLAVDAVVAANLYAGREWETLEDEDDLLAERRRRRHSAAR